MRTSLVVALVGGLLAAACGGPQPPPFKPMTDNKLLMDAVIEPAADRIWESVGWVITIDGEQEIQPQNDEEWHEIRNAAITVAESGNLLMMVPRAKDSDEWMRIATGMIDTGMKLAEAADRKDKKALFDVGGELYSVCSNCHMKYSPEVARVSGGPASN